MFVIYEALEIGLLWIVLMQSVLMYQ